VSLGHTNAAWRERVARELDATTARQAQFKNVIEHSDGHMYVAGQRFGLPGPANYREQYRKGWLNIGDLMPDFPNPFPDGEADSIASGKFYKDARNAQTSFEAPTFLGEIAKTAIMIKNRSKEMVGLIPGWRKRAQRSARLRTNKQRLKGLAQNYLEFKFGWDQLARDIDTVTVPLSLDFRQGVKVSGRGTRSESVSIATSNVDTGNLHYENTIVETRSYSVKYEGMVSVRRSGIEGIREGFGIMPSNFLPTLYELMPWSFMIDYFSNLGEIVNAISFDHSDLRWVCKTWRNTVERRFLRGRSARPINAFDGVPVVMIAQPEHTVLMSKHLGRESSFPSIPSLVLKRPRAVSEAGRQQLLNTAAVLAAKGLGLSSSSTLHY
jgi:hypothetical protein